MQHLIEPHGSSALNALFVADLRENEQLQEEAQRLPSIVVSSAAAANAVMLGAGYFNPLAGYMNKADALSVARDLKTTTGLFWPAPVLNLVQDASALAPGQRVALRDPNVVGAPFWRSWTSRRSKRSPARRRTSSSITSSARRIRTTRASPHSLAQGRTLLSGPIKVLNFSYFQTEFPDTFRTAVEIRNEIAERGWNKVVAFQTRNPMHRAHEELCRMAMDRLEADGLVIHMLLGKLKEGDIPAPVRDAAIRKMVEIYFPPNSAMVTGYGFDMLYAGPREALLHAVFRQNMGASYLIVGRDHAGVGDYYGPFDAQTIFDDIPADSLKIEIFRADNTAYSKKLKKVVMMREAPGHTKDDFIALSGTKVREMLGNGIAPPAEFSRAEVAEILIDYYRGLEDRAR